MSKRELDVQPRICAANIENLKIYMSLYSYLKIILSFIIHHSVHYRKLCLIIG